MSFTFELACVGRAAVDLYGEQIGCRLEDVSTFAKYLGGSPANTAVGASRLGLKAAMITRVGNEQNGKFVRETLAREGVDTSQVVTDPERLTALVFLAIRDADNFPHIFYRDNCADMALAPGDIDARFVASCGALLVSGTHLSREGTLAACRVAMKAARAAGAKVILDIDYRPVLWGLAQHGEGAARYVASQEVSTRLAPLLTECDLIVGTEEEIRIAGGSGDTLTALRQIRDASRALIIVKRGPEGCIAFSGPIPGELTAGLVAPGFPVEVFNVLGAGDAFMAGFLRGWLRNEPLETCCRFANACGAIVVSRHGCAPAMATERELQQFLFQGVRHARLREDVALEHTHHATTRRPIAPQLHILAFDHRSQLEALAREQGAPVSRIAGFKALVTEAFEQVAGSNPGHGLLLDDRYGSELLPRLTGRGFWIARPVEVPGSIPVAFERDPQVGLALRTWPAEHVAKCLVFYGAHDAPELKTRQLERLAEIAEACAITSRELLLEVISPPDSPRDREAIARAMEEIYATGIKPDWWKLPPAAHPDSWRAIALALERHDPLCRGVLVLGMEAGAEELREGFGAAVRNPCVRGFAVGRTIFADSATQWFAGKSSDTQVVDTVARNYREVISLWKGALQGVPGMAANRLKESA